MASGNKITINGSNLLSEISHAWGGVNETQSAENHYGTSVPAGREWGVNRGEVERFIKQKLSEHDIKIGWQEWILDNSTNFYHLLGFANQHDYELYDSDPETYESLVLVDLTLPISTVQGDSYSSYLFTNANLTTNLVVQEPTLSAGFRFHAVRNSNGERINTNERGTLQIERSVDNGVTWSRVGNLVNAMVSTDYSNTTSYTTVELGQYLYPTISNC